LLIRIYQLSNQNDEDVMVSLDEDDMKEIRSLNIPFRYLDGKVFETESDMYRNVF